MTEEQVKAIKAYDRYIEGHPELTKQKIEYIRQIQRAISKKKEK